MTTIELVTEIDAPVPLVFDLARDLDLHARSMAHTGERAIAGRTSGLVEEGDTVTWHARHLGRWWSLTSRITTMEWPHRFVDVQDGGPFAWFRHEHRFDTTTDGTRMRDRWEHRSPLGVLGRLVDAAFLGRYMRAQLVARNTALKAEAERRARAA